MTRFGCSIEPKIDKIPKHINDACKQYTFTLVLKIQCIQAAFTMNANQNSKHAGKYTVTMLSNSLHSFKTPGNVIFEHVD